MKALTLWQPWASLVACGAKTIETRSWSTRYRGPLAIHAAARRPDVEMLEDGPAGELYGPETEDYESDVLAQWGETAACDWMPDRLPPPSLRWWLALAPDFEVKTMPLGAVVATCELADVVPMVSYGESATGSYLVVNEPHEGELPHQRGGMWVIGTGPWNRGTPTRVEDQRPFGDFRPGRFAWLLENVEPLDEPVPAKGHQGLWGWKRG